MNYIIFITLLFLSSSSSSSSFHILQALLQPLKNLIKQQAITFSTFIENPSITLNLTKKPLKTTIKKKKKKKELKSLKIIYKNITNKLTRKIDPIFCATSHFRTLYFVGFS